MKKVNKMNFLLEETSKWLLSLGLIISEAYQGRVRKTDCRLFITE